MLKPVKLPEGWRGWETLTLTQKLGKTFLGALFESLNSKTANFLYLWSRCAHFYIPIQIQIFSILKNYVKRKGKSLLKLKERYYKILI